MDTTGKELIKSLKRPLIFLFGVILLVNLLLYVSLWLFPYAETIFLAIQFLVGINMFMIYNYIKESLMFHTCQRIERDQDKFIKVVGNEKVSTKMLSYKYPMDDLGWWARYNLGDYFAAFLCLVEGKVKVLP
mmetsp:Transcript_29886/g.26437  ORF Transcript_29886/g.26437 Transcript_29886/m.26437 type:complete len:132 (-) Transcript_29886:558-953(-)